jgi:hypothetical protein
MKLKILALIAALIAALPAIILMLNLTAYALTGAGFLVPGVGGINEARLTVAFISLVLCIGLFGASLEV